MRNLVVAAVLVLSISALAQNQKQIAPVVCVSAAPDTSGKSIGPLGYLNDDLAKEISERRKPLQGLGVPTDINGHAQPSDECDYMLEITLHVGGTTGVALNPSEPNPYDPTNDPRRATANLLVQAFYRLTSTSKAGQKIKLEDRSWEQYTPNVIGYGKDLATVAKRVAHTASDNAAGRLKKKLKI